jgi:hypothetical protein
MDIGYDAVLAALRAPHGRAMRLRDRHMWREANLIDETLIEAFLPLMVALGDEIAWPRAIRQLCDLTAPLALDALATEEFGRFRLRVSAALLVPQIATVASIDDLRRVIGDAIAIGAPTYNNGDPLTCALLYFATALTLTLAPTTRGIAGQARALRPLRTALDDAPAQSLQAASSASDYAWQLRRALDASLALMGAV